MVQIAADRKYMLHILTYPLFGKRIKQVSKIDFNAECAGWAIHLNLQLGLTQTHNVFTKRGSSHNCS